MNTKRIRKIDIFAILALAIAWSGITHFLSPYSTAQFTALMLLTAVFTAFTALLVNKAGSVIIFTAFAGLISEGTANLSSGAGKFAVLMAAGAVFEITRILINKKKHNIPLGAIAGSALSNLSIPITLLFLIPEKAKALMMSAGNLSITSFMIGIAGGAVGFLAWYRIKSTKPVIKFEYMV